MFKNSKSENFETLCAAFIGFGQLFLMVGYDSESFILESVIHSIHERDPERISPYAGYYGQAVLYFGYMMVGFISPSVIAKLGPKRTLVLAACCFTAFPVGFLFTNSYYYYFSSIVLGGGLALYYQGTGGYVTSHSTRGTIEKNVSLGWSIGCCCFFVGSSIMAGIIGYTESHKQTSEIKISSSERRFSDYEITLLFSVFTFLGSLGILNYILMPSEDVPNCIEASKPEKSQFWKEFKLTILTTFDWKMLQLVPLFALCGLNTSFWMSVFPTAMHFSKQNHNLIYIPAIYSLGLGVGEVFMGLTISKMSGKVKNFGQKPTMTIGAICTLIYCGLIQLSTHHEAPIMPTDKEPILFAHSYYLIFLIALICGIGDCCINSVRSVICALAMPKRRAQAFSVSKIYQALASCILFFLSPITPLYIYTIGLPILAIFATILFFQIAKKTKTMERKLTVDQNNCNKV